MSTPDSFKKEISQLLLNFLLLYYSSDFSLLAIMDDVIWQSTGN